MDKLKAIKTQLYAVADAQYDNIEQCFHAMKAQLKGQMSDDEILDKLAEVMATANSISHDTIRQQMESTRKRIDELGAAIGGEV